MSMKARRIAKVHKLLGLVVGLQLLFWTASGLFFTLFPIEAVRGEHLRTEPAAIDVEELGQVTLPALAGEAGAIELRTLLGRPVWQVSAEDDVALYDAASGQPLAPLDEAEVRTLAESRWLGEGDISSVRWVETPPRETFRETPLWRVEFSGKDGAVFWVDADAAELVAVRTTRWRIFDTLWRFHIMDVTGKDRFDTWWLKVFAFLGLTTVLFGFALLADRASKGRLLK